LIGLFGIDVIMKMYFLFRAQSGTGKTATFSISILQCLDTQVRETQALILSRLKIAKDINILLEFTGYTNMFDTS
jgi:ATP-dependent RNA helicase